MIVRELYCFETSAILYGEKKVEEDLPAVTESLPIGLEVWIFVSKSI